jgi:S1-C subfamily serine protease
VFIRGTMAAAVASLAVTASGETATPAERLNLSVVAIDSRIGADRVLASGTVVNADDGLVLTSAHAVWGATSLKVGTALGVLHGRIVARAPCDGLALIEIQPRLPGLLSLEPGPEPAPGVLLTAAGRRRTDPDAGTSSLLTIPARAAVVGARVRLDSPLVPEAAGGPILDGDGKLVAMATRGGAAVPWATVRDRLEDLRFGERHVYVGWREQYRCAADLHRYAHASHPGYRRSHAHLDAPVPATRLPGTEELD